MNTPIKLIFLLILSANSIAGMYSADDYLNRYALNRNDTEVFDVSSCNDLQWIHQPICERIQIHINEKLSRIDFDINNDFLIYSYTERFPGGGKKIAERHYLKNFTLNSYSNSQKNINLNYTSDDIYSPLLTYFDISGDIEGNGTVEYRYTICKIKYVCNEDYEENMQLKAKGDFSFDIYNALSVNPVVAYNKRTDNYEVFLQPRIRIASRSSDFDINEIDIKTGLGRAIISSISTFNGLKFDSMIYATLLGGPNGFLEHIKDAIIVDALQGTAISFYTAFESDFLSAFLPLTNFIYDDEIDAIGERALSLHERDINSSLRALFETDSAGTLRMSIDSSEIKGKSIAKILPALTMIL